MFLARAPAPGLRGLVIGYWFLEDLLGAHAGAPIWTSPSPGAALTIHFGSPNATADGNPVPRASLLGLQTRARSWRSGPETAFVMVMLTVPGLARLFPETGLGTRDDLLDLGAVAGDHVAMRLVDGLVAAWQPARVAVELDRWLLARLDNRRAFDSPRFAAAYAQLRLHGRVDAAAAAVGVSTRQLQRWALAYSGLTPKQLFDLERLHASLNAVQTGRGDPSSGYSDQAHQIRSWKRRLGTTPGQYARTRPSLMAAHFTQDVDPACPGWSHWL